MATLTTPVMGLPYPDGAERVMDGDNAIGALATAIDGPLGRQENAPGAVASGASTAIAAAGRLTLTGGVTGTAATIVNNGLTIAAGKGGLYLVIASGTSVPGATGTDARVTLRRTGTVLAGSGPGIIPGASVRWECSAVLPLVPGDDLYVQAEAAWSHALTRFQLVRLGAAMV